MTNKLKYREQAGYKDFLKEYARKMLVEQWAPEFVNTGTLEMGLDVKGSSLDEDAFEFCVSRNWISSNRLKITGAGFKIAASTLRR